MGCIWYVLIGTMVGNVLVYVCGSSSCIVFRELYVWEEVICVVVVGVLSVMIFVDILICRVLGGMLSLSCRFVGAIV